MQDGALAADRDEKKIPEHMVEIMSMGVAAAVTKPEGGKKDGYPKQPRVSLPASGG